MLGREVMATSWPNDLAVSAMCVSVFHFVTAEIVSP